jgi:HD-like signal output (HDOD) protein
MPQEVLAVVLNHHNVHYQGEWANYVRLAILADTLLKKDHGGDGELNSLPGTVLVALGLTDDDALEALATLAEQQEGIDALVSHIVAA